MPIALHSRGTWFPLKILWVPPKPVYFTVCILPHLIFTWKLSLFCPQHGLWYIWPLNLTPSLPRSERERSKNEGSPPGFKLGASCTRKHSPPMARPSGVAISRLYETCFYDIIVHFLHFPLLGFAGLSTVRVKVITVKSVLTGLINRWIYIQYQEC